MPRHPTRAIPAGHTTGMSTWLPPAIMILQHGLSSGTSTSRGTEFGDHPGTGDTIQATGVHGGLITGTITTGTITTGTTTTTRTTVTGITCAAGVTGPITITMCAFTVRPW